MAAVKSSSTLSPVYVYAKQYSSSWYGIDASCLTETAARLKEENVDPSRIVTLADNSYLKKALSAERQATLVIPGGDTISTLASFKSEVSKVQEVVDSGWNYLGFCAGANIACRTLKVAYKDSTGDFASNDLPFLALLPVDALIPVYGAYYERSKGKNVPVRPFSKEIEVFQCHYQDGSKFIPTSKDSSITALAFYDDVEGKPLAALSASYGKGRVVVTAIHPEITLKDSSSKPCRAFLKNLFTQSGISNV